MTRARQRQIENRRERRQGKELTQRWIIAAQSRRETEDEEKWWVKNINQTHRKQAKQVRRDNNNPPGGGKVTINLSEKEEAFETTNDTAPTASRVVTDPPGEPVGEKWFEGRKDIQPCKPWLLAILILPVIAVVTLLIGTITAYKRISSTHS